MNKKEIISLICALEKNPNHLTKQHLKKIYAILIACGHFPTCPWCEQPIYNINDFTWDHIIPKSAGGNDSLNNLQPMHKRCNNASKNNLVYQTEHTYDIRTNLEETVLTVRILSPKKHDNKNPEQNKSKKQHYKNSLKQKKR